jgi:hypothetical protein
MVVHRRLVNTPRRAHQRQGAVRDTSVILARYYREKSLFPQCMSVVASLELVVHCEVLRHRISIVRIDQPWFLTCQLD